MKNKTVIEVITKRGRQYNNFQSAVQSTNLDKQRKYNLDAITQAKYEAHFLL